MRRRRSGGITEILAYEDKWCTVGPATQQTLAQRMTADILKREAGDMTIEPGKPYTHRMKNIYRSTNADYVRIKPPGLAEGARKPSVAVLKAIVFLFSYA